LFSLEQVRDDAAVIERRVREIRRTQTGAGQTENTQGSSQTSSEGHRAPPVRGRQGADGHCAEAPRSRLLRQGGEPVTLFLGVQKCAYPVITVLR